MNKNLNRAFTSTLGLVSAVIFYLAFGIIFLILPIVPLLNIGDILDMYKLQVPKGDADIIMIFVFSTVLYLSMKIKPFRALYNLFPVLLPLFQMAFIIVTATSFGLFFMNLWAENGTISKLAATVLTILCLILGRCFMSYWYYKYPISFKVRKS